MQDETLKELQDFACSLDNIQKEKEQEQINFWNYIFNKENEK